MKAINVPRQYEHMLRKSKGSTDEYKPVLRNYIEQMEGSVLTGADFQKALNVSSATLHVKKLMKLGYITRKATRKGRGRAFVYTWHSVPLHHTQAALKNGEVVTPA